MMEIFINILVLFIENFYFYIPINEILRNNTTKEKIILYFKIFFLNILSTLIFKDSIFRYIFSFISMYLSIFYFSKENKNKNKILEFFIIPILFFVKAILEYLVYILFFNMVDYILFVIILETISLLVVILLKNNYLKIYYKIKGFWNGGKEFYFRYLILVIFNVFIIFLIFNLLKIKEVL